MDSLRFVTSTSPHLPVLFIPSTFSLNVSARTDSFVSFQKPWTPKSAMRSIKASQSYHRVSRPGQPKMQVGKDMDTYMNKWPTEEIPVSKASLELIKDAVTADELLDEYDVVIVGGGPAGSALAAAFDQDTTGKKVLLVDAALDRIWPPNYGVWPSEFEKTGYDGNECFSKVWPKTTVHMGNEGFSKVLERPYARIDREKLKGAVLRRCFANPNLHVLHGKVGQLTETDELWTTMELTCMERKAVARKLAAAVTADAVALRNAPLPRKGSGNGLAERHDDENPVQSAITNVFGAIANFFSEVDDSDESDNEYADIDVESAIRKPFSITSTKKSEGGYQGERVPVKRTIRSRLVVDCSGHSLKLIKHQEKHDPGYQAAYGIECIVDSHPFPLDEMLLMDYRDLHMQDSPEAQEEAEDFPLFLYAMPMSETRIFFEETSLVARPPIPYDYLKKQLYKRLTHYGVKVEQVLEEEFCLIPMGGSLPSFDQRLVGFGGAGGLVHPATGYSLTRSMNAAQFTAASILRHLNDENHNKTVNTVSRAVWNDLWNPARLQQRDFLIFGGEFLMKQNLSTIRQFFWAFFRLPVETWSEFLAFGLLRPQERFMYGLTIFFLTTNSIRFKLMAEAMSGQGLILLNSINPFIYEAPTVESQDQARE